MIHDYFFGMSEKDIADYKEAEQQIEAERKEQYHADDTTRRRGNISVFRSCYYSCIYCAFQKFQKISTCQKCRGGENHSHLEVLQRKPPRTKEGEFLTVGLSGDVSFMPIDNFNAVLNYCTWWADRTFLIQSKNPEYFLRVIEPAGHLGIPDNVILGTTIEGTYTVFQKQNYNLDKNPHEFITYKKAGTGRFKHISEAPLPQYRYAAMLKLPCRKAVTCEPLIDFDLEKMVRWITDIAPEFCYIGYANDGKQGKRLKLPEPPLEKTLELISKLREAGVEVRTKTLRPAWYEENPRY